MEEGLLLGAFLGNFSVTLFSDIWGRKITLLFGIFLAVVGAFITLIGPIYWIKFIGLMVWGFGAECNFLVCFTLVIDIVAR